MKNIILFSLIVTIHVSCGSNKSIEAKKITINDGVALCGTDTESRLQKCINTRCKTDYSDVLAKAYAFEGASNSYVYLDIVNKGDKCMTKTFSSFEGEKSCTFDLLFNKYFQKSAEILRNKEYLLDQHYLNQKIKDIKTEEEYLKWMVEYKDLFKKHNSDEDVNRRFAETYPDFKKTISENCSGSKSLTPEQKSYKKRLAQYSGEISKHQMRLSKINFVKMKEYQNSLYDASEKFLSECKSGVMESCKNVGAYFSYRGDYENSAYSYEKACELGDVASCTNASYNFHVAKLPAKAKQMATKACEGKEPIGCYNLACFQCGRKNKIEALRLFNHAISLDKEGVLLKIQKEVIDDPEIQCISDSKEFKDFSNIEVKEKTN